jgi:hypothetical protein
MYTAQDAKDDDGRKVMTLSQLVKSNALPIWLTVTLYLLFSASTMYYIPSCLIIHLVLFNFGCFLFFILGGGVAFVIQYTLMFIIGLN